MSALLGNTCYFILRAMQANGLGVLTSIDIQSDVRRLLSAEERWPWDLRVLRRLQPFALLDGRKAFGIA